MALLPFVLLVDDDSTTNYVNRKLLTRLAVAEHIRVAENGRQALDLLQGELADQPVLVFLDVNMPVMNGLQFLEAYAQRPSDQQHAAVVMLTTSLNPQDRQRAEQYPIVDFLSKPLNEQQVGHVLRLRFP